MQLHISWPITKPKQPLCTVRSARRHHSRCAAAAVAAAVVLGLGNVGSGEKKFDRRRKLSKRRAFQISASVVATTTAAAVQHTSQAAAAATVAAARGSPRRQGDSPSWCGFFFPAQFAPFLHRNSELLVNGFDIFLGNTLVHICLEGTNNSRNVI